ncbi:hypothetical protein DFS34DRAFT_561864, partial [Phlyctochytrium arcticum]
EQFIEKAKVVHHANYDYSETVYTLMGNSVRIVCRVPGHGAFEFTARAILNGTGCNRCGVHRTGLKSITSKPLVAFTKDTFIEAATAVHGSKYGYSKAVYKNTKTNVTVTCGVHGDFEVTAGHLLRGHGCKPCGNLTRNNALRKSTADFKAEAIDVHGYRYDYSGVDHTKSTTKVTIRCRIHGNFEQAPVILRGSGCPACSGVKLYDTASWIAAAKLVHGSTYGYGAAVYTNSDKMMTITCEKHGDFQQLASSHVQGNG